MPTPTKKEAQFKEGDLIKANHLLFGKCLALVVSANTSKIIPSWAGYKFLFIILAKSTDAKPWAFSHGRNAELNHLMNFKQWNNPLTREICVQYSDKSSWQFHDHDWIAKEKISEMTSKCQLQNQIKLFQFLNPLSITT